MGKTYQGEIDFIVISEKKKCFIQIANYLSGNQTIEREFGAFKPISDAFPKYVLSMDRLDFSRDGISHINIVDFLLGKKDINLDIVSQIKKYYVIVAHHINFIPCEPLGKTAYKALSISKSKHFRRKN